MPVVRTIGGASLWCALVLAGCRNSPSHCPEATVLVDPYEIPPGSNETDVFVEVSLPNPDFGLEVTTELTSTSGAFADPFAQATTYACAYDVSGPVEICVDVKYSEDDREAEGGDPNIGVSYQYLRKPHSRIPDPLECSETHCTTVVCPEEKNACPVVSSLTVEPVNVPEGGTATIDVVAEDPDDNPNGLVTHLTARRGTIADPSALQTTYACDPNFGGGIEICVVASDGDSSCDVTRCTVALCPGEPEENVCPIIEALTANPNPIPAGEETTTVRVDATDLDDFPEPLRTEFSSDGGAFEDRFARETTFRCGVPGAVEVCVEVSDGDLSCDDESRCITVQCPSDIQANECPNLFVINAWPRQIPDTQNWTHVETRAQETDYFPFPLALTLDSLWGEFIQTENIWTGNVVSQDAIYICDRPGAVEICVNASDGACMKTSCDVVTCPANIPTPP